jgi:hypothetical protein
MSFVGAFDYILSMQKRTVTYTVVDTATNYTIEVSPANFSRNLNGPEEVTFPGREYVISKTNLVKAGYAGSPKKNHRIVDAEFGTRTIEEVKEMVLLGQLIGFRVRTN